MSQVSLQCCHQGSSCEGLNFSCRKKQRWGRQHSWAFHPVFFQRRRLGENSLCPLFHIIIYLDAQERRPSCTLTNTGAPLIVIDLSNCIAFASGTCTFCAELNFLILQLFSLVLDLLLDRIVRPLSYPRLAGWQSWRKPLWSYPTLPQDLDCPEYFVILPLKIELDERNPPLCLHAFLLPFCTACYTKSIRAALTADYMWNVKELFF